MPRKIHKAEEIVSVCPPFFIAGEVDVQDGQYLHLVRSCCQRRVRHYIGMRLCKHDPE
jgi:hypothetical protein